MKKKFDQNNLESVIDFAFKIVVQLQGTIKGTQLAIKYMGKNDYGCKMSTQNVITL